LYLCGSPLRCRASEGRLRSCNCFAAGASARVQHCGADWFAHTPCRARRNLRWPATPCTDTLTTLVFPASAGDLLLYSRTVACRDTGGIGCPNRSFSLATFAPPAGPRPAHAVAARSNLRSPPPSRCGPSSRRGGRCIWRSHCSRLAILSQAGPACGGSTPARPCSLGFPPRQISVPSDPNPSFCAHLAPPDMRNSSWFRRRIFLVLLVGWLKPSRGNGVGSI